MIILFISLIFGASLVICDVEEGKVAVKDCQSLEQCTETRDVK